MPGNVLGYIRKKIEDGADWNSSLYQSSKYLDLLFYVIGGSIKKNKNFFFLNDDVGHVE